MIACTSLYKTFGQVTALDHIDLTIAKGSIYGLVGSNGAGKSTLMRTIAGIYQPDSGELTVEGAPVWEQPAQKQRILLVADEPYVFSQADLDEMARFYQQFYLRFDWQQYQQLADSFSLPRRKKIAHFSKGMKRQAAFLLAVAACPDYLMLDECFDGLDPVKRQVVRKVLADHVAEGMTAIISSHNLRELDEICDTVGILHKGRLLYSKELDDLKGDVCKLQAVFAAPVEEQALAQSLPLLSMEQRGKFYTIILRSHPQEAEQLLAPFRPLAVEAYPLTLEEIFLYEMEVLGYDAAVIFQ